MSKQVTPADLDKLATDVLSIINGFERDLKQIKAKQTQSTTGIVSAVPTAPAATNPALEKRINDLEAKINTQLQAIDGKVSQLLQGIQKEALQQIIDQVPK